MGRELDQLKDETTLERAFLADKYSSARVVKEEDGLTTIECINADNGLLEMLYFEEPIGYCGEATTRGCGAARKRAVSVRFDVYEKVGDIRLP